MSSHTFATFGWRSGSLDDRARKLQEALGIELEPRDSLYRGEYYNWRGEGSGHVILQENFIEADDGLRCYEEYPEHIVLLFGTDVPSGWVERIATLDGAERLDGDEEG